MARVRFAPSPTGNLHIGGARTALFNWLYAKSQNGEFILRIEDTDRQRSKQEFLDEILDSLGWLGLKWDKLYKQSDRFELYKRYALQLIEKGLARKEGEAVIFDIPKKDYFWYDLLADKVTFQELPTYELVLMKSDGSPTYSFACVVDDLDMEITHVIRGDDHISNTPKQLALYEALGKKPPKFAHMPMILDEFGSKMSKRTGAVALSEYRQMGYLPEAFVNYLMLLGWSPGGNQEIVSLEEATRKFSIKKVSRTASCFSMDKLKWVNSQHIREKTTDELYELILPLAEESSFLKTSEDKERLREAIELFKGRISTLRDFIQWAGFLFQPDIEYDKEATQKYLTKDKKELLLELKDRLLGLDVFDKERIESAFRDLVKEKGIEARSLVHPVRVAISGTSIGPGLFETLEVLGKERLVQRIDKAVEYIEEDN